MSFKFEFFIALLGVRILLASFLFMSFMLFRYQLISIFFVTLSLFTSQVYAADLAKLEDLMAEAVKTHPTILGKKSEYEAAGYTLDGAKWARFPSATAEVRALDTGTNNTVLRVEQPLWTGGRITSQIEIANAGIGIADAAVHESEQAILQEVATAFYEVQRLEARLKFAVKNELEHQKLAESMRRRVQSEISPMSDENQTLIRLRNTVAERIQTERQLMAAKISLDQVVGRSVGNLAKPENLNLQGLTEELLLAYAREFSPERKRLQAKIESAESEVTLAKSRLMPQIVAGYQHQIGTLPIGIDRDQAYLALQMQPGAGLSSYSGIQAAIAKKQAAVEELSAFERQLTQRLRTAWADYKTLSAQLQPALDSAAGSEMIVASYVRQFQVGKKNWLEVLNSQRERAQAQYVLADVESPLQLAGVKLLVISGLIRADKVTLNETR